MKQRIVVADRRSAERAPRTAVADPARAWKLALWIGAVLALIGWTDLVLIWYPAQWGSPEWEFGTISTAVNAVPLGTIGLAAMVAAAMTLGRGRLLFGLGLGAWAAAVFLAALAVVYLLVVPIAWRATPAAAAATMKATIGKTLFFLLLYITTYTLIGVIAARRPGPRPVS